MFRVGTTVRTMEGGHVTLLPWRSGCRAIGGMLVGGRLKTLSSVCLPSSLFVSFNTENCCSERGNALFLESIVTAEIENKNMSLKKCTVLIVD